MSVINSFVGRINSVQTDISSSIKSIGTRQKKKKVIAAAPELEGVNLDVGADILQFYQENWAKYSKAARENAKRYEAVDKAILAEYETMKTQHASMKALANIVSELPQITESINGAVLRLGTLESDIGEIESQLIILEDLCDRQDADNNKVHHQQQLSMYKQRKDMEIEQLKLTLAQEHASKVAMYENRLQSNLREKQAALDDKYSAEMKHYKEYGTTHLKPSVVAPQIDVCEITLDEDRGELDSFLNIECSSTPSTDQSAAIADIEDEQEDDEDEDEDEDDGPESNQAVIIGTPPVEIKEDEDVDIAALTLSDQHVADPGNADSVQDSDPESLQTEAKKSLPPEGIQPPVPSTHPS